VNVRPAFAQQRQPVRFVFGVHVHQPVGNFDHVFEEHARNVYKPLVAQLERRRMRPALLHVSGPLLEWMEAHDTGLVDRIGRLVTDGALELLLSGMYEPILTAIPRADRVQQIAWHREALHARFGAAGDGLWLTERVWEPGLAADLADAGVRYVFVDDRHFLVTGFTRDELHVPFRTESDGKSVAVLAIDARLRHLVPFKPPGDIEAYLRAAYEESRPLAIFADDGEKFGGWPGTREWVYDRGWFDEFCDMLDTLQDQGVIRFCGGREAVETVPCRGPVYLPTASYQEMEAWALPPDASRRLAAIEHDLGHERMAGADRALIRGAHWQNFLAKYSESNRMQKKAAALSALARARGAPESVRRAIGRAQCNDAYWHGVFGGLYLPHLRSAIWRELAAAEGAMRAGETLCVDTGDFDGDGADEIWIHSDEFSAMVAPARGGALIELTRFGSGINHADVLTRRLEAYHLPAPAALSAEDRARGVASIHDMEASLGMEAPPPVDLADRAIGVARVLPAALTADAYAAAAYEPVASWARARCAGTYEIAGEVVTVRCELPGLTVVWRFGVSGRVGLAFQWDGSAFSEGQRFAPELSLAGHVEIRAPEAHDTWRYAVETVAKSVEGTERVVQGHSVTPLFDARRGEAKLSIA
jgi:hypothetical protein